MVLPAARTSHLKMTSANGSQQLDKNLEGAQPTVPVLKSSSPTSSQLAITPDNKNWDGGRIPHWQPPGEASVGGEKLSVWVTATVACAAVHFVGYIHTYFVVCVAF